MEFQNLHAPPLHTGYSPTNRRTSSSDFTRTTTRSFGLSRIQPGMFARASSPLRFNPGSRRALIAEQFRDAPEMIGESCCHGRGTRTPEMAGVTQLLVRDAEVRRTSNQIPSCLQSFQTMSRMTTFAGQGGQTLPQGPIEALDQGGIELLAARSHLQQLLCLLKRSQRELACDFHHAFVHRALDHGGDTELRPPF